MPLLNNDSGDMTGNEEEKDRTKNPVWIQLIVYILLYLMHLFTLELIKSHVYRHSM